jgi:hypothetical protein
MWMQFVCLVAETELRPSLFCDVKRRKLVVTYRRFRTVSVPSSKVKHSKKVPSSSVKHFDCLAVEDETDSVPKRR